MEQQLYKVCYSVTRNDVSGYERYTWIPCNGDEEQAKEMIEQMEEITERGSELG
jgi:hypothetical protein